MVLRILGGVFPLVCVSIDLQYWSFPFLLISKGEREWKYGRKMEYGESFKFFLGFVEIRLGLTLMPNGEHVRIIVLALMSRWTYY